jgi:hypothetical protein
LDFLGFAEASEWGKFEVSITKHLILINMKAPYRNMAEFKSALDSDENLKKMFEADPEQTIKTMVQLPDTKVYRLIVWFVGLTVMIVAASYVVLTLSGIEKFPEGLLALGTTALGALAGLLAPSPTNA